MRQICPGPCAFCRERNQAHEVLLAFQALDTSGSGTIERSSLTLILEKLGAGDRSEQIVECAAAIADRESSGCLRYEEVVKWVFRAGRDPEQLAASLGFVCPTPTTLEYGPAFQPPVRLTCGLLMVPHGKTPSNERHLFQNHADGPLSQLVPDGVKGAERGAADFVREYGPRMRERLGDWVLYRSPLKRTGDTAAPYVSALRAAGIPVPEPTVDVDLIEINQGSWCEHTVEELRQAGRLEEAELAAQYRGGSFAARAADGSGECLLEVAYRAASWLQVLQARHGDGKTNVLVFGHGTFQNSVELLMRVYPDKSPGQLFTRVSGGSHLRRGESHVISPLV